MSIESYNVKETKTGTGSVSQYTANFKIFAKTDIIAVKRNASGTEIARVTGDDTSTLISSLTFDTDASTVTINLLSNLESSYTLDIFLAPSEDQPLQDSVFRNKNSFTLKLFETALDKIAGPLQRTIFLATRSVKLKDVLTLSSFDVNLPADIIGSVSKVIGTNSSGNGLEMGPTFTEISNAQGYATAAATAQTAAEAAQTAAEAAQTAAETAQAAAEAAASTASASAPPAVETALTNGMSATTIGTGVTEYTFDPGDTEWVSIEYSVYRGTTVAGRGYVEMVYDGSAWVLFEGSYETEDGKALDSGLTFSLSTNTLQVATDSGPGAGKLFTRAFQA